MLVNKVEHLLEQNRDYQNKLLDKNYGVQDEKCNESFKSVNDYHDRPRDTFVYSEEPALKNERDQYSLKNDYTYLKKPMLINEQDPYAMKLNNSIKIKDQNNSTMFYDDMNNARPFKLENDYDEQLDKQNLLSKQKSANIKISKPNVFNPSFVRNQGNNGKYEVNDTYMDSLRVKIDGNSYKRNIDYEMRKDSLQKQNRETVIQDVGYGICRQNLENATRKQVHSSAQDPVMHNEIKQEFAQDEDVKSQDSSKTVKTTSSLKEMIEKTEGLQNRFELLEKQLEQIYEGDAPESKKLHDQLKAYTDYYYSDYLDLSNENDIL